MKKKEYDRHYYHDCVDKQRKIDLQRQRIHRIKETINKYLEEHPCTDCGETDIVVLEFDHVSGEKDQNISDAIRRGWSLARLFKEIEKCEVRCANCHRRVTHKRRNSL